MDLTLVAAESVEGLLGGAEIKYCLRSILPSPANTFFGCPPAAVMCTHFRSVTASLSSGESEKMYLGEFVHAI